MLEEEKHYLALKYQWEVVANRILIPWKRTIPGTRLSLSSISMNMTYLTQIRFSIGYRGFRGTTGREFCMIIAKELQSTIFLKGILSLGRIYAISSTTLGVHFIINARRALFHLKIHQHF